MKQGCILIAVVFLIAGCVPVPQPFTSPIHVENGNKVFLPWTISPDNRRWGVGVDAFGPYPCPKLQEIGAEWFFDWSPHPERCQGVDVIPMLWAPGDGPVISTGSPYLLLLNECDLVGQCNRRPLDAAIWWHYWEDTYPTARLIGPNTSHLGLDWLLEWHAEFVRVYGHKPRMWALGVHCYDSVEDCQEWVRLNEGLAELWTESGKVWLTEWATGTVEQADEFLCWLDSEPGVARAAWFILELPGQFTSLYEGNELTKFGLWYKALLNP